MHRNFFKILFTSVFIFYCFCHSVAQADYVNRANALLQTNETNKARVCIDSCIHNSKYSNDGQAWYIRGYVYKAIYNAKEKGNVQSPARITALESFEKSMKLDASANNTMESKKNIKFLATSLFNDVNKGLDTINYTVALQNFEIFKKYYILSDTSKANLISNDIKFKFALANVYEKLFEKSPVLDAKAKYFNLGNQLYDEILSESNNDPKAKYNKATFMAKAAVYQIDVNKQIYTKDLNVKASTINKLDKDNQLKQSEIQTKELVIQTKEQVIKEKVLESDAKTRVIELLKEEKILKDKELRQEAIIRNTFVGGFIIMLLCTVVFFRQRNKIAIEKRRSDDLLLNILPEEVADELKKTGSAQAKHYNHVSVLFTDFVGFTRISEKLSPEELVEEIHQCFTAFDEIIDRNGLEKIKTIGDAYLAVCGMPNEDKSHARKAVQASIEIMEFINKRIIIGGKFKIRIGINSGPVVAGIVGVKKFAYDIWGDTVNTAARMEQTSENGKINISGNTYELVKNDFTFQYRGKIDAKNKGEIDMYFVEM